MAEVENKVREHHGLPVAGSALAAVQAEMDGETEMDGEMETEL